MINSEEKISIGISNPYLRNESAVTMFYHKHFSFEILFNYDSDKYSLEVINIDIIDSEDIYLKSCKDEILSSNIDYLLYSTVYSSDSFLFFKVQLINPYDDVVVFSKLYISTSILYHKLDF